MFKVHPLPVVSESDGSTVLQCHFEYPDHRNEPVFLRFNNVPDISPPTLCDWMAIASIFPAMKYAQALHIHGAVSASLLANLSEFNAAWNVWRPETYARLEITADRVEETVPNCEKTGYVFAFSGGIDACATLARHAGNTMGWRRRQPAFALLVHGFDITLGNEAGYATAFKRALVITESLGVSLGRVATNLKDLPVNWEDSFAAMLSTVLTGAGGGLRGGVIASCESYAHPVVPWGSNPISNPLLGSSAFPLHTDGAELTRLEKVALVASSKPALENMRVCWEGSQQGVNCGECEKCVRTQLELLALRINNLSAFEKPLTPGSILRVPIKNSLQASYIAEALMYAQKEQIDDWWVHELKKLIARNSEQGIANVFERFLCRVEVFFKKPTKLLRYAFTKAMIAIKHFKN